MDMSMVQTKLWLLWGLHAIRAGANYSSNKRTNKTSTELCLRSGETAHQEQYDRAGELRCVV